METTQAAAACITALLALIEQADHTRVPSADLARQLRAAADEAAALVARPEVDPAVRDDTRAVAAQAHLTARGLEHPRGHGLLAA